MSTSDNGIYKGYCPECSHGMLVQTQVKMAAKMGDVFFINDNNHHYQCNFCGICIATDEAMQLMLFSSNAIEQEVTAFDKAVEGRLYLQE